MIKLVKVAFLSFVLTLSVMVSAEAQQKFAHVNTAELLREMPDVKNVEQKIAEFTKGLEEQMKSMTQEYQTKVADFQAKQSSFSEPVRDAKIKEVQDIERRIQEFQQKASEDINKEREKYFAPVIQRVNEAIKVVAKEKGLAYVFDTSQPGVIYFEGGEDIMASVKAKIKPADPIAPSVSPATPAGKPAPTKR